MSVWNTSFETFPTGTSFGSVAAKALRELKQAVQTRFSKEHTFDTTVSAVCPHLAGQCRVIGLSDGAPSYEDVLGALWHDYTNAQLLRDRGTGLGGELIATKDHSSLLNLDAVDAHENAVLLAGDSGVNLWLYLGVIGLPTNEDLSWGDNYILSQGAHLGESVHGGAKHPDGSADGDQVRHAASLNPIPSHKFATDSFDQTFTGAKGWVFSGRCAFFPRALTAHDYVYLLPLFTGAAGTAIPDHWKAGITFYNDSGANMRLNYRVKRIAES